MQPDDHWLAVYFAHRHSPLDRPAIVVSEVGRIAQLAEESVGYLQPGVGSDRFSHAFPVPLVETVNIEAQQLLEFGVLRPWPLRSFGHSRQFCAATFQCGFDHRQP
jgi:hypothetical protein